MKQARQPFEIVYRWTDSAKREADVVWARTAGDALRKFGTATGMVHIETREAA